MNLHIRSGTGGARHATAVNLNPSPVSVEDGNGRRVAKAVFKETSAGIVEFYDKEIGRVHLR